MSFPWMLASKGGGDVLLKSTIISFVLLALIWRAWVSHQATKSPMTPLCSWSFPSDTHPMMAVSSENLWIWQWSESYLKAEVSRLNRKGERTVPCGAPALLTSTSDAQSRRLTYCGLLAR